MEDLKRINIRFKSQQSKGSSVLEATFFCLDGRSLLRVEFVDATAFSGSDPRVDFDVNNLKLQRSAGGARIIQKYPDQGGSVESICDNIRQHKLTCVKSLSEIPTIRISKMKTRGWKIV